MPAGDTVACTPPVAPVTDIETGPAKLKSRTTATGTSTPQLETLTSVDTVLAVNAARRSRWTVKVRVVEPTPASAGVAVTVNAAGVAPVGVASGSAAISSAVCEPFAGSGANTACTPDGSVPL